MEFSGGLPLEGGNLVRHFGIKNPKSLFISIHSSQIYSYLIVKKERIPLSLNYVSYLDDFSLIDTLEGNFGFESIGICINKGF